MWEGNIKVRGSEFNIQIRSGEGVSGASDTRHE